MSPADPTRYESLAVLETETIHDGLAALDAMVKVARTEILAATPIPPGRFLIALGGPVGEVEPTQRRGLGVALARHDELFLAETHPAVYDAIRALGASAGARAVPENEAVGLFETASVCSGIDAADRAAKGAAVQLVALHLARGIAGKCFGVLSGRQDMVEAALALAEERGRSHGRWIGSTLLARPDPQVIRRFVAGGWGFVSGQEVL